MAVRLSNEEKEKLERIKKLFKKWIADIFDVISLLIAVKNLQEKIDQIKSDAHNFLFEFGKNDGRGNYIWSGLKNGLMYVLKGKSQFSYSVDKDKFVDLVGFETAVKHMELPAMTRLIKLAEGGSLKRRDGTALTEDEIRAISKSEKRDKLKISFELLPAETSIDDILAKMSKEDKEE